ncbi:hypothetical protein CO174_00135 [Candidatus Uhrbacteria bacterium CG_4_9_14_3_um_filter_50_9]|uniref:Inositol monophosphatase n=1 Tax=Candidatus Uhrbacteria bacterium CG_4_9_14_3_um_filter_50_9 TaxID=1975035 RepID=A0A2M7XEV4_9BACT|nr:MAG: hypothetical protein CO174_00135 [Candidatus Uhrbacteria bacterium CG_4_9_14_3_um_filter_50_9]
MFGPLIGRTMKDCAERVIASFPKYQDSNEFEIKRIRDNGSPDWVGKADKRAQQVYEKLIREDWVHTFGFGMIGEEDDLRIPCVIPGHDVYFTCDPYDGTGAMKRGQSHGVGTMVALVCDGKVVAALVGDTNSQELYYFRPGSDKTHRIKLRSQTSNELVIDDQLPLAEQVLLLRSMPFELSRVIQAMVVDQGKELFKKAVATNGSIGVSMAQLWKGEVGGAVMALGNSTPWDTSPVIGLSLRLGFDFYYVQSPTKYSFHHAQQGEPMGRLVRYSPVPPKETVNEPHEIFVVHSSRREELVAWGERRNIRVTI